MKHATTPYYEPKIFKTSPPELAKKRFPWFHVIICFLAIAAFIGATIYNLATKTEFISNGGLQGVLFTIEQVVILCALLASGFLLFKKQRHFVWPIFGTFAVVFIMELTFTFWDIPEDPEQLAALITPEKISQFGIGLLMVLFMIPLFGSMSDKLKLYMTHRELFEG